MRRGRNQIIRDRAYIVQGTRDQASNAQGSGDPGFIPQMIRDQGNSVTVTVTVSYSMGRRVGVGLE